MARWIDRMSGEGDEDEEIHNHSCLFRPSLTRRIPIAARLGLTKILPVLLVAIVFSSSSRGTVASFVCQPKIEPRRKVCSKQTLWHRISENGATGESTNQVDTLRRKRDAIEPSNITTTHAATTTTIVHGGIGPNVLFERRTIIAVAAKTSLASIVTGRTLAFSGIGASAMLAGPSASQASTLSLTPRERKDASSSSVSIDSMVDLPLEYIPTLGAYVVRYVLFGEAFAAIVDTGSPFLTVPCYCKPYRNQKMFWGCYRPERTSDSGYGNTIEGFDNNYGKVVWRKAGFSFSQSAATAENVAATTEESTTTDVVFGVLDQDLLNGSGGVFFGLIKETDSWIRPSFLGQTGYTSFCIDLRHTGDNANANTNAGNRGENNAKQSMKSNGRLVLSKQPMIGTGAWRKSASLPEGYERDSGETEDFVPLVRDLRKKYGAPVVHYTAKASKFVVNGLPLLITKKNPLYVIFDSGVSGMVVSQDLFDGRNLQARKNKEKSLWGTVEVSFATNSGKEITLRAKKPVTTPLGKATPWKGFRGNLVAVGLAFLDGLAMTVDIDDGKILFAEE